MKFFATTSSPGTDRSMLVFCWSRGCLGEEGNGRARGLKGVGEEWARVGKRGEAGRQGVTGEYACKGREGLLECSGGVHGTAGNVCVLSSACLGVRGAGAPLSPGWGCGHGFLALRRRGVHTCPGATWCVFGVGACLSAQCMGHVRFSSACTRARTRSVQVVSRERRVTSRHQASGTLGAKKG